MAKLKTKKGVIILILFAAFFLRFYNLMFDAPYFFNPDERNMAIAITKFRLPKLASEIPQCITSELLPLSLPLTLSPSRCSLNPHFFAYSQFPLYLAFASDQITKPFINSINKLLPKTDDENSIHFLGGQENNDYLHTDFPIAIFWLRFYSVLSSSLAVLVVFLISRQLTTVSFSLIATTLVAFTPGLIQSAHFGTTESMLTFFFMISVYLSLGLYSRLNNLKSLKYIKYVFLLSLVIGLALGSKLTGIFLFVPPMLCTTIRAGQAFSTSKKSKPILLFAYLFICLFVIIGSLFIFILSSPYNLIEYQDFKSAVFGYEQDVATGKFDAFYTKQFVNSIPILFQAEKVFPYTLGWPLFILGSLGLFALLIKLISRFLLPILKKAKKILKQESATFALNSIVFASFAIYFLPNTFLYAKWSRFMTPILPFFSIFAAYFLIQISNSELKVSKPKFKYFKNWIIGLLVIAAILPGIAFMSIYTKDDVRVTASKWIYENIPDNSYVLSETANVVDIPLGFPKVSMHTKNYKVVSFDFYHTDENPKLFDYLLTHLEKADYIFIPSRRIFYNYPSLADKYPLIRKYYQLLFSGELGFEKVMQFSSFPTYGIWPLTIEYDDEPSEETFTVFDHPVVRIYKKIRPMEKQEYKSLFDIKKNSNTR